MVSDHSRAKPKSGSRKIRRDSHITECRDLWDLFHPSDYITDLITNEKVGNGLRYSVF